MSNEGRKEITIDHEVCHQFTLAHTESNEYVLQALIL